MSPKRTLNVGPDVGPVTRRKENLTMTRAEKAVFVDELVESVKQDVLMKFSQMPEEWDGIELRQYLADVFARSAHWGNSKMRLRAYRNEVLVRNL
jgi:hypothetical protein